MKTVFIDCYENPSLRQLLTASVGCQIRLSNGCELSLSEEGGCFLGVTPYGIDTPITFEGDWLTAILNWIEYWNDPRDETGALLSADADFLGASAI